MKILLLGKNGQLGWELSRSLPTLGGLVSLDFPEIDLSKPEAVRSLVRANRPDVIVNATAYTAVDKAETESDLAYAVNAHAPAILAAEARALGAVLIHYSTDYVFDGSKGGMYTEDDIPNPLNVYGASKLAGEQEVGASGADFLVLRTAWVYSTRQGGFVNKVLEWARKNQTLRIVDDQVSNPTWARTLAELTAQTVAGGLERLRGHTGLYHVAGGGCASRYKWAREILELDPQKQEQVVRDFLPAKTAEFPAPAVRPLYSALDCRRFEAEFGLVLPAWQEALRLAMG